MRHNYSKSLGTVWFLRIWCVNANVICRFKFSFVLKFSRILNVSDNKSRHLYQIRCHFEFLLSENTNMALPWKFWSIVLHISLTPVHNLADCVLIINCLLVDKLVIFFYLICWLEVFFPGPWIWGPIPYLIG